MITPEQAIQMAREVGSLVRNGDHCFDDEELTAFANAIRRKTLLDAAAFVETEEITGVAALILRDMAEEE